ncbi:DUF1573 domain-containing protein [Marinoscillum sp. MHG1-6]|uniref:DUF1573 domain-containing protein n=1 Tax=Marinoscillum sp. MHG1-6 TaxID=2959627 RepID=UPI0021575441|nr:DUF1573 domain-containing protein [Marinoscillum sp. MHG1-6]
MLRNIWIVILVMGLHFVLLAQNEVGFIEKKFDFGKIGAVGGRLDHSFLFVNKSTDPVSVIGLRSGCECIVGEWPSEAIAPGDSGAIEVGYFSSGRLGYFSESIQVQFKSRESVSLEISGHVIYDDAELVHLEFGQGAIYSKSQKLSLGTLYEGDTISKSILIQNQSEDTVIFDLSRSTGPNPISWFLSDKQMGPNEVQELVFKMNTSGLQPGYRMDEVELITDEKDSVKTYQLSSVIVPSPQREGASGRISLDRDSHDFGMVPEGDSVVTTFQLINTGRGDLEILRVEPNCSCIGVLLPKERLESYERLDFQVYFLTEGRRDNEYKRVALYTNDPNHPVRVISLKARVQP